MNRDYPLPKSKTTKMFSDGSSVNVVTTKNRRNKIKTVTKNYTPGVAKSWRNRFNKKNPVWTSKTVDTVNTKTGKGKTKKITRDNTGGLSHTNTFH